MPRSRSQLAIRTTSRATVRRPAVSRRLRRRGPNSLVSSLPTPTPRSLALHPDVLGYIRCLSDPFTYPPVRLGFGCLTSTQTVTLTARLTVSAGVDGQVSGYVIPSVNYTASAGICGGLYTSNSAGGALLASVETAWQNRGVVGAMFDEARVVSAAIRAFPMIPGTSPPGLAMVASIPSTNYTNLEALTKANAVVNPLFQWGQAAAGVSVCSRPIDPDSFTFHHETLYGLPVTSDPSVTTPIFIMNGLPVGASVFIEAVLQVEGVYGLTAQAQAVQSLQTTNAPTSTLSSVFSSIESMWRTVSSYLPAPATIRSAAMLANTLLAPDLRDNSRSQTRYLPSTVTGRLMP